MHFIIYNQDAFLLRLYSLQLTLSHKKKCQHGNLQKVQIDPFIKLSIANGHRHRIYDLEQTSGYMEPSERKIGIKELGHPFFIVLFMLVHSANGL